MDDQKTAARADLPTYEDILNNTEHGCATLLPMIVGWCIAEFRGIISAADLRSVCEKHAMLIKAETAHAPSCGDFRVLLPSMKPGQLDETALGNLLDRLRYKPFIRFQLIER
jgi:hypothetical protein